jgi:large subunit ribosomal protein L18
MKLSEKLKHRYNKRKKRIRFRLNNSDQRFRILVNKTNKHFHAQVYDNQEKKVVGGITSTRKDFKPKGGYNSIESCKLLAKEMVELLKKQKISEVVYDRSGFRYHGKVKHFAETLKKSGIKI